jgi:hypothetical protein
VKKLPTGPSSNEVSKQMKLQQINFKTNYQSIRPAPARDTIPTDRELVTRTDPTLPADGAFDLEGQTFARMTTTKKAAVHPNSNTALQPKKYKKSISPYATQKQQENVKKKRARDLEARNGQGQASGAPPGLQQAQSQMTLPWE